MTYYGAMACDTTRHAGWGLHNRRAPVRFLSHLPLSPECMGIAAPMASTYCLCSDPYLTAMAYHQVYHRRYLPATLLVMAYLLQQSPVTY
jgi:hypothetical protein